jgi:dTDP-4-amino-4,6-dideoxygalactose transaminase
MSMDLPPALEARIAGLAPLVRARRFDTPRYVTRPVMPPLDAYTELLRGVWDRRWLTNDGELHQRLERELEAYLGVNHASLFCNGTLSLLVALQALDLRVGEVITTPFTFPATTNVLHWNRLRPVFCDVDPVTLNIDPERVSAAFTDQTRAILAVHVYGQPCDVAALQELGARHGVPVVYDAAHAFGVRLNGQPLLEWGNVSSLSFHATKLFTTGEGGALVTADPALDSRIRSLKNFGIADEETVLAPGINAKMSELSAAFGLLRLRDVDAEIAARAQVTAAYRRSLDGVPGLTLPPQPANVTLNHSYFPILVDAHVFGLDRDELYTALRLFNVIARKYFYPLTSHYEWDRCYPSADPANLPVAERAALRVLCLPVYGELGAAEAGAIGDIIAELHQAARR